MHEFIDGRLAQGGLGGLTSFYPWWRCREPTPSVDNEAASVNTLFVWLCALDFATIIAWELLMELLWFGCSGTSMLY